MIQKEINVYTVYILYMQVNEKLHNTIYQFVVSVFFPVSVFSSSFLTIDPNWEIKLVRSPYMGGIFWNYGKETYPPTHSTSLAWSSVEDQKTQTTSTYKLSPYQLEGGS